MAAIRVNRDVRILQSQEFNDLIRNILVERGRLRGSKLELFMNPENMQIFRQAFTHSSSNPDNNYELLEFLGDRSVNCELAYYIHERLPRIKNIEWLNKIDHYFKSDKFLAQQSLRIHLDRFIVFGPDFLFENLTNKDKNHIYEDVFEALMGAIQLISENVSNSGVGAVIIRNIIRSFIKPIEIQLDANLYWDPITRVKEVYDKMRWLDKGTKMEFFYEIEYDENTQMNTAVFYGYKSNAPQFVGKKRSFQYFNTYKEPLGQATAPSELEAVNTAAEQVLINIRDRYGVEFRAPDPYTIKNKAIPRAARKI